MCFASACILSVLAGPAIHGSTIQAGGCSGWDVLETPTSVAQTRFCFCGLVGSCKHLGRAAAKESEAEPLRGRAGCARPGQDSWRSWHLHLGVMDALLGVDVKGAFNTSYTRRGIPYTPVRISYSILWIPVRCKSKLRIQPKFAGSGDSCSACVSVSLCICMRV